MVILILLFRIKGRKPLLVLHFIDLFEDTNSLRYSYIEDDLAHAAWSISFPPTKHHQEPTQYIVNKVWIQMNLFDKTIRIK